MSCSFTPCLSSCLVGEGAMTVSSALAVRPKAKPRCRRIPEGIIPSSGRTVRIVVVFILACSSRVDSDLSTTLVLFGGTCPRVRFQRAMLVCLSFMPYRTIFTNKSVLNRIRPLHLHLSFATVLTSFQVSLYPCSSMRGSLLHMLHCRFLF